MKHNFKALSYELRKPTTLDFDVEVTCQSIEGDIYIITEQVRASDERIAEHMAMQKVLMDNDFNLAPCSAEVVKI